MENSRSNSGGLSVSLSVRPARVGVFVPRVPGISWMRLFELAIATQMRSWGGTGHLVFPMTADFADRELFWALADRLDADSWAAYGVSVQDLETLDPRWHAEHLSQLRKQLHDLDDEAVEQFFEEHRHAIALDDLPADEQVVPVRRRLAPLHHTQDEPLEMTSDVNAPHWPFVDVAAFSNPPGAVDSPTTRLGPLFSLLLTASVGRVTPTFEAALSPRGVVVTRPTLGTKLAWGQLVFQGVPGVYPRALAEHGLGWYTHRVLNPPRAIAVVGDSAWDFALFYALKRWLGNAVWLPSWIRRDALLCHMAVNALARVARTSTSPVSVVTAGSSVRPRDELVKLLKEDIRGLQAEAVHWRDVLPDWPNRLFELDGLGRFQHVPQVGEVTAQLQTPVPQTVSCNDPSDLRWLTEVDVDGWSPVRHANVGPAIVRARSYGTELARVTRTGAAYFCPDFMYPGGASLETVKVNPRLAPLDLLGQVQAAVAGDWDVALSDKGIFAAETSRLCGGRAELVRLLRDPTRSTLMRGYLRAVGIKLRDRRFVSLKHVRDLFPDAPEAGESALKELVEKGVLVRGIVLNCGRCRNTAWYGLDQVAADFRCERCRLVQPLEARWRGEPEPHWYYRLEEVVYQFLTHNGHLPVLALEAWLADTRTPVAVSEEIKFTHRRDGTEFELDLVASRAIASGSARHLSPDGSRQPVA